MSRGKVGPRPLLDATLLSASAIGSPAAFSTAIKPPGSFNTHPSDADASLLLHRPHELSRLSDNDNVAGQLSLSLTSEHSHTKGAAADETSFGILDLDNIHESSMSAFLTSPRTSRDLVGSNLPLVSPTSRGLTTSASRLPPSPPASMEPLRLSGTVGTLGGSQAIEQDHGEEEEGGGEGEEVGLPEDLLEVSSSVGYSTDEEREGEGEEEGGGGENLDRGSSTKQSGVSSAPTVPDQVRRSGDGDENKSLGQGLPHLPHISQSSLSTSWSPLQDRGGEGGGGFSVSEILQEAQRGGENISNSHLFLNTGNSLITDQEEPSVMRRAADFSRFEPPDQLTSVLERETLLQRAHPVADGGDKTMRTLSVAAQFMTATAGNTTVTLSNAVGDGAVGRGRFDRGRVEGNVESGPDDLDTSALTAEDTSPQGLPSAYLYQSSVHSSPSGSPDSSPPLSPHPPPHTSLPTLTSSRLASGQSAGEEASNSLYNPFDSEDGVGEVMLGNEEFKGVMDSNSFMAQLKADEAALEEANKFLLPEEFVATAPTSTPSSFPPPSLPPSLPRSGERELSMGEYFGRQSYKMGVLEGSGTVSSSERPQFSWLSTGSSLPTPPSKGREPKTSQQPPPPLEVSPGPADTTLVASEDGGLGGGEESPNASQPASNSHPHSLGSELAKTGGVSGNFAQTFSSSPTTSSVLPKLPPSSDKRGSPTNTSVSAPSKLLPTSTGQVGTLTSYPNTTVSVPENATIGANTVVVSAAPLVSRADSLTPVVTVHTPFPMQYQIPKLDFSGLSKTLNATPNVPSLTTGLKISPPSYVSAKISTSHPVAKSPPVARPSQGVTLTSPTHVATTTTSLLTPRMEPSRQTSGMDSGLSTGMEHRLDSQYWRPSSGASTLMFPELSATLSPPPTIAGLSSMPTPSIANLSGGFNATATSEDHNFMESLLGSFPSHTSLGSPSLLENLKASRLSNPNTFESANPGKKDQHHYSPPTSVASSSTKTPSDITKSGEKKKTLPRSPPSSSSASKLSQSSPIKTQSSTLNVSTGSASGAISTSVGQLSANGAISTNAGQLGKAESPVKQRPSSPRTDTAKIKITQLKAALDATEFDAATFLSRLEEEKGSPVAQPRVSLTSTTTGSVPRLSAASEASTSVHQSPRTASTSLPTTVACQTPTKVGHQSLTTASKVMTTTISSTTLVNQTTTRVGQNPTFAPTMLNQTSTTTAGKTTTTVGQTTTTPTSIVSQPSNAVSSTSVLPTATTIASSGSSTVQKVSPSPPKPSVTSPLSASKASQTSSTANSVPSTTSSDPLNLNSPPGNDVEGKARKKEEKKRPRQHQSVEVRDIGVETTPSLHRTQTRSSTHIQTSRSLEDPLMNITRPSKRSHTAPLSPSTSPQRMAPTSSPFSPPSSSIAPLSKTRKHSSSSQPIYTSPRLLPHTSLSPPPQPHPTPLTPRERRKTPVPNSLQVPDSLIFKTPCCVGVTLPDQLQISNTGDRWLQLSFELRELYCNGTPETDLSPFSFPQKCFLSPRKTELIKIGFSPKQAGSYEAVLICQARLVVSSGKDGPNFIKESVVVKALAVPPLLEVATPSTDSEETCLDYGLLTAGTSLSLPLHLSNLGSSELPLRLSIAAPTLSQLYFSFDNPPPTLKTPSSSPSSYLHQRPFSATFVLPPKPQGRDARRETHTLNVNFKSPKNFADESTLLGSPEEIKAQVNISVEGPNATGVLYTVPIRVTVGVARLHVPRSLQALSLSSSQGRSITRDVPFKNAGNIPLQIALEFSPDCKHFYVTPDFLELSPSEEAQIEVSFSPDSSPLVINGQLMVHVQPHGPSYELKVQGTSLANEETDGKHENLLFCNKRYLYWGGVEVGATAQLKLLLQNSFSSTVPLQFSIRLQNHGFQLAGSATQEHSAQLPEQTQHQLNLVFSPSSPAVFCNALDIFDTLHSKKFRIPLCGYGGTSGIEVISARRSTSGGLWVDLGPVTVQHKASVKISLYNSGSRAGFVKALVLPVNESGEDFSPLPPSKASVSPSECVLQPQQIKELKITYTPTSSDEVEKCLEATTPLARLVVIHGDEIIRQRFQTACMAGGEEGEGEEGTVEYTLNNQFNQNFLPEFPGQESVESELDFVQFEVENEETFFEQQMSQIEVTLSGSPATTLPAHTTSSRKKTQHQPLSTSFDTPPRQMKNLVSPPNSPPKTAPPPPGHPSALPSSSLSSQIVSSLTLVFPETSSGQRSEKTMDVHNPYSQPLQWKLSSVASPFVRDAPGASSTICKANYSVFWVHERKGTTAPHSTTQVLVMFQPHDVGSFSQIWDLQVTCKALEGGSKKIRLSFGGKAVGKRSKAEQTPRVRFTTPPSPLHSTKPPSPALSTSHPPTLTTDTTSHPPTLTTKRAVYIKEEAIQFPSTEVGSESSVKVKVCNRDKCQHQFEVVSLSPPFSVEHHSFLLGSRQCARLPIRFTPARPGVFDAVLAVKTAAGHQAFSQLTGTATPHEL